MHSRYHCEIWHYPSMKPPMGEAKISSDNMYHSATKQMQALTIIANLTLSCRYWGRHRRGCRRSVGKPSAPSAGVGRGNVGRRRALLQRPAKADCPGMIRYRKAASVLNLMYGAHNCANESVLSTTKRFVSNIRWHCYPFSIGLVCDSTSSQY